MASLGEFDEETFSGGRMRGLGDGWYGDWVSVDSWCAFWMTGRRELNSFSKIPRSNRRGPRRNARGWPS